VSRTRNPHVFLDGLGPVPEKCSGGDPHGFLNSLDPVAAKISDHDTHGFLDGLSLVVVQAVVPLIQCPGHGLASAVPTVM
jgi:hypothetical protein